MKRKKYQTYDKSGRVKYHSSLVLAKLRAKKNKDFVDIVEGGITKSLFDFRDGGFNDPKFKVRRKIIKKRKKR